MDLTSNKKCKIQITDVFYQLQKNCQIALSPGHGTIANSDAVARSCETAEMFVVYKLSKTPEKAVATLHILSAFNFPEMKTAT